MAFDLRLALWQFLRSPSRSSRVGWLLGCAGQHSLAPLPANRLTDTLPRDSGE